MTVTDLSSAPEQDFNLDQGFDRDFSLVYKIDGVPVDMTGWRVAMGVKAGYAEPAYLLYVDSDDPQDSFVQIDGVNGRTIIHLDHVDTAQLPAPKWLVYDIRFYNPLGGQPKMLFGKFYVRPQVTASA